MAGPWDEARFHRGREDVGLIGASGSGAPAIGSPAETRDVAGRPSRGLAHPMPVASRVQVRVLKGDRQASPVAAVVRARAGSARQNRSKTSCSSPGASPTAVVADRHGDRVTIAGDVT